MFLWGNAYSVDPEVPTPTCGSHRLLRSFTLDSDPDRLESTDRVRYHVGLGRQTKTLCVNGRLYTFGVSVDYRSLIILEDVELLFLSVVLNFYPLLWSTLPRTDN